MSQHPESTPAPQAGQDTVPVPALTHEQLAFAYRCAVRSRSLEAHIVRMVSRGDVKFAIWGTGEEVSNAAFAMALEEVVNPDHFGIVPHYRSGALCGTWAKLRGMEDYEGQVLRQQFSRATDKMSGGRQMVYHLHMPDVGILPVQSPVGMQLGKAAGYALGYRKQDIHDSVSIGIIGDGTSAEGDLHDSMNAASVWNLPVMFVVTDNEVAISTGPAEGRGIQSFSAYAESFGLQAFDCDGRSFTETYETIVRALRVVKDEQRPVFLHVHDLPRFNGHSSAADVTFDMTQDDPLVAFGQELVDMGVFKPEDVMRRKEATGRDFFTHHDLGTVMTEEDEANKAWIEKVSAEPEPAPESIFDHIHPPYPAVDETPASGQTVISYAGALRSALDKLIERKGGVMMGQDIGKLGGVMQASAGLLAKHPNKVIDAPLNEPLIVGTSTGLALHEELMALPEVQFGDYSLNAFHWLVHLGNLYWSSNGNAEANLVLRMPTDPFGGGAIYHSMSLDGFFTPIPGLVIVMPSTSFDAHGLLLAAGEYKGPVVFLEPKWMYRQTLGPAFPGEPTEAKDIAALKKRIMRGEIPDVPDVYVPFGKAAIRREGSDCTVVSWGRAVWTAVEAAETMAKDGVNVEVIDLRTLVPPDMETVLASVKRTGRLVVCAEDRNFSGFVRQIQGEVVEAMPGTPTRAIGQKPIPGIAQSLVLEAATVLTADDIVNAVSEVRAETVQGNGGALWVAPRYFVS